MKILIVILILFLTTVASAEEIDWDALGSKSED